MLIMIRTIYIGIQALYISMEFPTLPTNSKLLPPPLTQLCSCNELTVTGTIILELHSNVCDYLRILLILTTVCTCVLLALYLT